MEPRRRAKGGSPAARIRAPDAGMTWTAAFGWLSAGYALLTGVYIVLENRRPQATCAWMRPASGGRCAAAGARTAAGGGRPQGRP